MATITHEIDICEDCLMASANGLQGWDYDENWLEAYEKACERYGADPTPACGEDCDGHFSRRPCDFCGSTLGGYRHPAVIMAR